MTAAVARALLLVLLALVGFAPAATAAPARTSLPDVEDEVMCVVCGVPLNVATEAPQAARQRELIRGRIAAGDTKAQIKNRLVAEYGPQVLAEPGNDGFDAAAWLVPVGLGLAAAVGVALVLPRWRRRLPASTSAGTGGAAGLAPSEARRLDEELARFDAAPR